MCVSLSDDDKNLYEKKRQLCWDAMTISEKFFTFRYFSGKLLNFLFIILVIGYFLNIWRYIRIKFLNLNTVKWLFISICSTLVLVALTYFFVQRKAIPFRFVKTYLFIVNHLFLQVAFNYRKSLVFGIYTRKQTG